MGGGGHSVFYLVSGKGAGIPSKQPACCASHAGPGSGHLQTESQARCLLLSEAVLAGLRTQTTSVHDCKMRKKATEPPMKTELKVEDSSGEDGSPVFFYFLSQNKKIFLSTNKHPPSRLVAWFASILSHSEGCLSVLFMVSSQELFGNNVFKAFF